MHSFPRFGGARRAAHVRALAALRAGALRCEDRQHVRLLLAERRRLSNLTILISFTGSGLVDLLSSFSSAAAAGAALPSAAARHHLRSLPPALFAPAVGPRRSDHLLVLPILALSG